jgi:hypothetical protein
MMTLIKAAPAVLLVLGLASAPSSASSVHQEAFVRLSAAERVSLKVQRTKVWLKAKKTQTTRWMGRQKQNLKRAID